jgi:uncharacterized protein
MSLSRYAGVSITRPEEDGVNTRLSVPSERLTEFCHRHRIRRLALFGSVLRGDYGDESDVDVLVEFDPNARVGLFALSGMEIELSELLDRKVDLRTAEDLSRSFREQVAAEAEVLYAA